jgi:hypothetical protein
MGKVEYLEKRIAVVRMNNPRANQLDTAFIDVIPPRTPA